MASLWMGDTSVDYYLSGKIKYVKIDGNVLYDERNGICVDGWKDSLARMVHEAGFDIDDGRGLHAFIYTLYEEGLLPYQPTSSSTTSGSGT